VCWLCAVYVGIVDTGNVGVVVLTWWEGQRRGVVVVCDVWVGPGAVLLVASLPLAGCFPSKATLSSRLWATLGGNVCFLCVSYLGIGVSEGAR
jgi:hypothetical protein